MDGPRKASVVIGTVEVANLSYTGDRSIKLGSSLEVADEARTRILGGGGTSEPTPEEELPS